MGDPARLSRVRGENLEVRGGGKAKQRRNLFKINYRLLIKQHFLVEINVDA